MNRHRNTIINRSIKVCLILFFCGMTLCHRNKSVSQEDTAVDTIVKVDSSGVQDSVKAAPDTVVSELSYDNEFEPFPHELISPVQSNTSQNRILQIAYENKQFNAIKWLDSDLKFKRRLHPNKISDYDRLIKKFARRYGFDWRLIAAQIYVESNFENKAESHVGAQGLMQIMPGTAKFMGANPSDLVNPEVNIAIGCMYNQRMFHLWKRQTDVPLQRLAFSLASYNAGRRRVLKSFDSDSDKTIWKLVHPDLPLETQSYVHKIFLKYDQYQTCVIP